MSESGRPRGVTIVAYFVIVVSSLMGVAYLTALPRPEAVWGIIESATKIALAIGMLKRVPWAPIAFLACWFLAALGVDLVVYRSQLHDPAFLAPRAIIVLAGVVYAVVLTRPNVRQWFGEDVPEISAEQRRRRIGVVGATAGALLVGASSALLLFFAWHLYLDALTLTWKKAPATIVASDIRGNVVRQVPRSGRPEDSSADERGATQATTTEITTHDPVITYRYVVDGTTYASSKFSTMKSTLSAVAAPERLRARYAPGSVQECWYDPNEPSNAVLQRGISPYYVFAPFLLIVLAVGRMLFRQGRAGYLNAQPG